jgi:hypothetical protein
MLPRIPNHLLSSLLCFMTTANTIPQQGIHTRGIATQVWPARHNLGVVDYKALTGLSLLWVPHFHASHGASLKIIHPDTTSTSITECFLVSRCNMRKHTNVSNPLELQVARVTYRVGQITHRAITKNKRDQVIVTMHVSKLNINTRTKHLRTTTQTIKKGKDTRAH